MTNPEIPAETEGYDLIWPRTIAEAVDRLQSTLSQTVKDETAAMPENKLLDLHFGLGIWVRNNFELWKKNITLLEECMKIRFEGRIDMPNLPSRIVWIHPDDASGIIIRAFWARLRH